MGVGIIEELFYRDMYAESIGDIYINYTGKHKFYVSNRETILNYTTNTIEPYYMFWLNGDGHARFMIDGVKYKVPVHIFKHIKNHKTYEDACDNVTNISEDDNKIMIRLIKEAVMSAVKEHFEVKAKVVNKADFDKHNKKFEVNITMQVDKKQFK